MKIGFGFPTGTDVDLTVAQCDQTAKSRIERWGQAHVARSARVNALALTITDTADGTYKHLGRGRRSIQSRNSSPNLSI